MTAHAREESKGWAIQVHTGTAVIAVTVTLGIGSSQELKHPASVLVVDGVPAYLLRLSRI